MNYGCSLRMFTLVLFEPLNTLHLEKSKVWKNCIASFIGSEMSCTKEPESLCGGKAFLSLKGLLLGMYNALLASIEYGFPVIWLRVDISKLEISGS